MRLSRSSSLDALSIPIAAGAFLLAKPPFRDEPLYIEYAHKLLENPLEPYPNLGFFIPHPPGFFYRLALGIKLGVPLRLRAFVLASLGYILLYKLTKNVYRLYVPGLAIYSFILFDDAIGAILATAAMIAIAEERYKLAMILYPLAAMFRFQSAAIAIAYALLKSLERKDFRPLIALLAVPIFLSHTGRVSLHFTLEPFLRYLYYLANPAFTLLFLPALKDKEALKVTLVSYLVNSFFGFYGYPRGYPRYYLTTAIFLATRLDRIDRKKYRLYLAIPAIFRPQMFPILALAYFMPAISFRLTTSILAYYVYYYAVPHPPYRLSRGESHHHIQTR